MSHTIDHVKRALRAELRERRQLLSPAQRAAAAEGFGEQLDALVAGLGAQTVSCYLSTPSEPGTRLFVQRAVARGIRVLLPISRSDHLLDWVVATQDGALTEGLFGLSEPIGEPLERTALNDVDLMIIPAAAVDGTGMRMGWGRGYFDRAISSLQHTPPIYAVVYDSEVLDEVPRDVHDQPVAGVVTQTRTLTFDAAHS